MPNQTATTMTATRPAPIPDLLNAAASIRELAFRNRGDVEVCAMLDETANILERRERTLCSAERKADEVSRMSEAQLRAAFPDSYPGASSCDAGGYAIANEAVHDRLWASAWRHTRLSERADPKARLVAQDAARRGHRVVFAFAESLGEADAEVSEAQAATVAHDRAVEVEAA